MSIQIYEAPQYSIPAQSSVDFTLTNLGEAVTGFGWQNAGNAYDLYASQMFPNASNGVYIELVNKSITSTDVWVYGIYETGNADTPIEPKCEVKTRPIEER